MTQNGNQDCPLNHNTRPSFYTILLEWVKHFDTYQFVACISRDQSYSNCGKVSAVDSSIMVVGALIHIVEVTKNICYGKGKGPIDHNRVTGWFRNFAWVAIMLIIRQSQVGLKTMDPENMVQAREANLASRTQRVSQVSLASHSLVWSIIFMTLAKAFGAAKLSLQFKRSLQIKTMELQDIWTRMKPVIEKDVEPIF